MPTEARYVGRACTRCVKRKKKCIPVEGSCTNCVRAKAECSNVRTNDGSKPNTRSLAEALQEVATHLKSELRENVGDEQDTPTLSRHTPPDLPSNVRTYLGGHAENQLSERKRQKHVFGADVAFWVTQSMNSRVTRGNVQPIHQLRLYTGAELPFPLTFRSEANKLGSAASSDTLMIWSRLPGDVTKKLLNVYVERVLPQCPIFSPKEVDTIYNRVFNSGAGTNQASDSDFFAISMIMATATMTSKADDYRRVLNVSEAFRQDAVNADANGHVLATVSVRSLQCLLLLAQYGLFAPNAVNLWHVVSEAMRIAIELGLHQEPPDGFSLDEEAINTRHRLFWAEKICEVNINSEVIQPIELTYAEWVASCERRIERLRGVKWTEEAILIPDWLDLPAWRCLAWLYMPCPRNPNPSVETVTKFIRALMHMLDIYWALAQKKSLKLSWFAVHHAYEIGTQVLYCMQNYPHIVKSCFDSISLLDALTHLSDFLTNMTERWPAALQCRTLLNKLKNGVFEHFLLGNVPDAILSENSGEQRIVDVIFRKNAFFFFAVEKPLDIQADFDALFSPSNAMVAVQDSIVGDNPFSYLEGGHLLELGDVSSALLDWFIESPSREVSILTLSNNPPTSATKSVQRTVKVQGLIDEYARIIENMPVCKSCKRKRIKCSRTLPSCHNCVDYGKHCLYLEHSTGEWVSGNYLRGLQSEVEKLLAALNEPRLSMPEQNMASHSLQNHPENTTCTISQSVSLQLQTSSGPSMTYFGEACVFARLVSASYLSVPQCFERPESPPEPPCLAYSNHARLLRTLDELLPSDVDLLSQVYCQKVETYYLILGVPRVLDTVKRFYGGASTDVRNDSYCEAQLNIIVAIALALPFHSRAISTPSTAIYFTRALSLAHSMEGLFLTSSIDSLRFTLLMCFYVWLDPTSGNLSRLVDAACRICFDLLESQELSVEETSMVHGLFRTTYALDTFTAITFGRPNYLPQWRNLEKMVILNTTYQHQAEKLSLLVYTVAGLQSAIHHEILKLGKSRHNESSLSLSRLMLLKSQADEWLDGWKREASNPQSNAEDPVLDVAANYCGVMLYSKTISLLRTLAENLDLSVKSELSLRITAPFIKTTRAWVEEEMNASTSISDSIAHPLCWTHYLDIFDMALNLFDVNLSNAAEIVNKDELLKDCHMLLRFFESSIGCAGWILSRVLKCLIKDFAFGENI